MTSTETSRIPAYDRISANGMRQWFEQMSQRGLLFHPEDSAETIIAPDGSRLFTDVESAQADAILKDMFDQHGNRVIDMCYPIFMRMAHAPTRGVSPGVSLQEKAIGVTRDLLEAGVIERARRAQTDIHRVDAFRAQQVRLEEQLAYFSGPDVDLGSPASLLRLGGMLEGLRQLQIIGVFKDLEKPPSPAAWPIGPPEMAKYREISGQVAAVLEAAEGAAPTLADSGQRAVGVLADLLAIATTDDWNGSGRLDSALADARDVVEAALGAERVAFSQQAFDAYDGASFWSEDEGWTELSRASIYREAVCARMSLPTAGSDDARWVSMPEAMALRDGIELEGPRP